VSYRLLFLRHVIVNDVVFSPSSSRFLTAIRRGPPAPGSRRCYPSCSLNGPRARSASRRAAHAPPNLRPPARALRRRVRSFVLAESFRQPRVMRRPVPRLPRTPASAFCLNVRRHGVRRGAEYPLASTRLRSCSRCRPPCALLDRMLYVPWRAARAACASAAPPRNNICGTFRLGSAAAVLGLAPGPPHPSRRSWFAVIRVLLLHVETLSSDTTRYARYAFDSAFRRSDRPRSVLQGHEALSPPERRFVQQIVRCESIAIEYPHPSPPRLIDLAAAWTDRLAPRLGGR